MIEAEVIVLAEDPQRDRLDAQLGSRGGRKTALVSLR